jgi:signal transduction histidine kinase
MRTRCPRRLAETALGCRVRTTRVSSQRRGRERRSHSLVGHGLRDERDGSGMTLELAEVAAAWPLAASFAAAVAARGLQAGRRRSALNEALHELRRPLQALALASSGAGARESSAVEWSLQMATAALERLDREVNGEAVAAAPAPVAFESLLDAAARRWQGRAARAGGSLDYRWRAGAATVDGDRCGLAQALDNLIVNAIEHGGPQIVVEASVCCGRLRVAVADSGRDSRPRSRRESPAALVERLRGRRRHGHGLRVVRRTAAAHGGDFSLRCSERGTEAVLELPFSSGPGGGE